MTPPTEPAGLALNISAVEREAGLSKDVLRMWERRYGFPKPVRDDNGERRYSVSEVAKLRAIKRLMDVGMRPGKIIRSTLDELNALADGRISPRRDQPTAAAEREILALLASHDAGALQTTLANLLMRQGENTQADIERHAKQWIQTHRAEVDRWLGEARSAAAGSR